MTNYIYALQDPVTDEIRYVGKSINPQERLKYHIKHLKRDTNLWKARWITKLLNQQLMPILLILEEVSATTTWQEAEMFWIAYLRAIGCNLTNLTIGGDRDTSNCRFKLQQLPQPKPLTRTKTGDRGPNTNSKQTYLITDPQGNQYTVKSIYHFVKSHPVSESMLHRSLRGKPNSKGYTCILL